MTDDGLLKAVARKHFVLQTSSLILELYDRTTRQERRLRGERDKAESQRLPETFTPDAGDAKGAQVSA
jgi:hypothetical protein